MDNNRVTAVGEILWDVYPEKKRLGGAPFNFIYHVWKLTGSAEFISNVGNDEYGKEILDFLKRKNFPTKYIAIDNLHPTGNVKVKLNEDKTPRFEISKECCYDYLTINEDAQKLIDEETELIYFGTLSQRSETSRNSIQSLFYKNKKYFCDLNLRHDFFSKEMIEKALITSNVIKINHDELNKLIALFNLSANTLKAIEQLTVNYNIDLVCVTLGEDGAILYNGKNFDKQKSEPKEIIDTVGAGDAFASLLCVGYLKRVDIKKINKLANEFAADICGENGALPKEDSIYNKYIREFENDS
jgi:fructokinase